MRDVLTWLIPASLILGIMLGLLGSWLYGGIVRHIRRRRRPVLASDLQLLVEELPLMAVVFDRSLTIVGRNRLAQQEPVKLGNLQETSWFRSYLREAMMSKASLVRPSNEDDPFWVHVFALQDGHVVALIADEQDKHDTESLRRDFIANASHELNTPVAAISLLAEAIQQASGDPLRTARFADSLSGEVARLTALTRDIARLSEAQTGWEDDSLHLVDPYQIATRSSETHHSLADSTGITLVVGPALEHPCLVRADERSLQVALDNLVENAIQHSQPGSHVGIAISTDDHTVHIKVSDQGEGIEESEQDKVFKRFYRIDSARTRRSGGTGLGLAIARNTARAFRGDVTLWSKPGVGSTLTITLPKATERD